MTRKAGWLHLVERFPQARKLWEVTDPDASDALTTGYRSVGTITAYSIGPVVVLLHTRPGPPDEASWDVYVQASSSVDVVTTLDDLERRIATLTGRS